MIWHKTKFGEWLNVAKVEAVGVYRKPGQPKEVKPYNVLARTASNAYKIDECEKQEEAQKIADAFIPGIIKSVNGGGQILVPGAGAGITH